MFFKKIKSKKVAYVLAVIFMLIPITLSLFPYVVERKFMIFFTKTYTIELTPTLLTTITAILLYSSVMIRNKEEYMDSFSKMFLHVLNITFLAGFLNVFLGIGKIPLINISSKAILIGAILFSWFGMKTLSGYIWIILVVVGMISATATDQAMKNLGYFYVICAFISFFMQMKACNLFKFKVNKIKEDMFCAKETIKEDLESATKHAENVTKKVADKIIK